MTTVNRRTNVARTETTETQGTRTLRNGAALNNARGTFDARNTLGVSSGGIRNVSGGLGHAATVLAESTRHSRPSHGPVA